MRNYIKLIFLLIVFNITVTTSLAQECVVLLPPGVPPIPESSYGDPLILQNYEPTFVRTVYIAAHIVRTSSGTGGITTDNLNTAIQQLKNAFLPAKITFVVNEITTIDNDNYVNLNRDIFIQLAQINHKPKKLNIYFVPFSNTSINGIAYLNSNICAVTNAAAINGSTLTHEVGHNFYLYHTHSDAVNPPNDCTPSRPLELVNGSNCLTAGDYLCDTPAEPFNCGKGVLGYVNSNTCNYFGTFRDSNYQLYNPDTKNFMGYSPANCRNKFSTQQIQKMNQTLSTSLSYLISESITLSNKVDGNIIPHTSLKPSALTVIGIATVNSGNSVNLLDGNTYQIRTNQERFSNYLSYGNIKHNNWNFITSEFRLTENYTVNRNASLFRDANFITLNYSKIESKVEGLSMDGKGSFQFQDPWYVFSNGTQPGNHWITATGFYEPTGKEGAQEKGVFLNQGWPSWQPPYYSVKAEAIQDILLPQTGKTHRFYFQNWSANPPNSAEFKNADTLETGVVFKNTNAVVQANLKGTQLTNTTEGFKNSGQRKLIVTSYPQSFYHLVYSSMGSVWYEKAQVNYNIISPVNWQLMNNTKALNSHLQNSEAKSPSIDFMYATHNTNEENYFIYIVYQHKKQDGKDAIRLTKFNKEGNKIFDIPVFESTTINFNSIDYTPVIAVSKGQGTAEPIKLVVLWKRPAEGSASAGLYYLAGFDRGNYIEWTDSYPNPTKINSTDANSSNPTIAVFKKPYGNINFHIAYQQGTTSIRYNHIVFGVNGTTPQNDILISSGNGSYTNITPSITVGNSSNNYNSNYDSPKVVWCSGDEGAVFYRFRANRWSPFYIYIENDDVTSPTISHPKYEPGGYDQGFYFGWSWLAGYYKSYVFTENLSVKNSMPYRGKDLQLATTGQNWDGFGYVVLDNHTYTSAPVVFENKWIASQLGKLNSNISAGRAGSVIKNEAEFYFAFGDIKLNDNSINFKSLNDTTTIETLEDLNSYLQTETFSVNDNDVITYSVFYGLKDSLVAFNNLFNDDYVRFSIQIIDANTQQLLSSVDNVIQRKTSLVEHENLSYQLSMQGIGQREIIIRLKVENNFNSEYSLSNIYSFNQRVSKSRIKQLRWNEESIVKEYSLEQNYPNPFNPTTTISFSLPTKSYVSLKVYDMLGREVATLVDEHRESGRYKVEWDGSNLSSGVYVYKIKAGSYVSSKKMVILK